MAKTGKTIRGFGDYHVGSNTILQGGMSPPMITNSVVNGGVIIRHREYLRDIPAATNFTNYEFPINPGISSSFPWLAQIATSFEQYRFRGLVFEFKSTSADNVLSGAASTALGTVVMGTKYNVLDEPFTNKFEMENWEFTSSCKPSLSCMHPIECAKSQTPVSMLYIRPGNQTTSSANVVGDLRLYDLCNFNLAVIGMQNSGPGFIGELWCTYEVELYKPKLEEDISTNFAHFDAILGQGLGYPNSLLPLGNLNGNPVGTKFYPSPATNSTLPCYIVPDTVNVPGGAKGRLHITDCIAKRLMIMLCYHWPTGITPITGYTPLALEITYCQGIERITAFESDSLYEFSAAQFPSPTTTVSHVIYSTIVEITSDDAWIAFDGFSYSGNGTSNYDFWITELGPNAD